MDKRNTCLTSGETQPDGSAIEFGVRVRSLTRNALCAEVAWARASGGCPPVGQREGASRIGPRKSASIRQPHRHLHLDEKRPYPANLCPLSGGVEFAGFGKDLGQPIGELIETVFG